MCRFYKLSSRLASSGKRLLSVAQNYSMIDRPYSLPPTILSKIFVDRSRSSSKFRKKSFQEKNIQRAVSFERPPCLRQDLLCKVTEPTRDAMNKVTIVGAGMVGVACANAILFQKISSHVAIVDAFPKKLEGEGMDYSHGRTFLDDPHVEYDTDFCVTSNSKVVVVAAGARQKKGETRLDLVQRNTDIFKNIIPPLVKYSPNAVFVIATNPVDVMSWLTWQISKLPVHRIIGSGCHLDTARLRYMIGDRIGVAPSSVHGYIIGEHGDSQVPLWSSFSISGVLLRDVLPNIGLESDEEGWNEIAKDVIRA
ncbi:L-lactate dehydrogenase B chain-like [Venturia canescens]|uniref:L-lactate dehydrogenase B chain-like n=1 Tax=Venturia canescens TaxID=32260 RepID=UPI001C9D4BC3|nr:L-lactate dehydrogenase B chain-like [Venturia canescens]